MQGVKLRFSDQTVADHPLGIGEHGVVRSNDGLELVEGASAPVRLCVDRRGVWLSIDGDGDGQGVHVNGRQVRRMAMLRVGDAIYVDGIEMRLVGAQPPEVPPPGLSGSDEAADPRVVLRGVGGRHHGRSFTLERPRLVGRVASADIRIDDVAFSERHARLERVGDQVLLRDLGSPEGSQVNGEPVRDALLNAGDQIVFDGLHRFVVEAPQRGLPAMPEPPGDGALVHVDHGPVEADASPAWRLPWVLLAALLLALLLSALLLFGPA
ncbi:FHA domain-containing protein [Luteimonas aestuarii]|uniref:FHA domain-containing protein n=1 Tax=Luteimonas aestuarii TaxID=453837 RepID=A0A4R5U4P6_9GAMM|nr:FHA domain-containing protein [Luteimonas aestuarii]TDK28742.1 FHA domain-containing protein [Luteimonas aestuarii]